MTRSDSSCGPTCCARASGVQSRRPRAPPACSNRASTLTCAAHGSRVYTYNRRSWVHDATWCALLPAADGKPQPIDGLITVTPPAEPQSDEERQQGGQAAGQAPQGEQQTQGSTEQPGQEAQEAGEPALPPTGVPDPSSTPAGDAAPERTGDSSQASGRRQGGPQPSSGGGPSSSDSGSQAADSGSAGQGAGSGTDDGPGSPSEASSHHPAAVIAALGGLLVLSALGVPRLARALQASRALWNRSPCCWRPVMRSGVLQRDAHPVLSCVSPLCTLTWGSLQMLLRTGHPIRAAGAASACQQACHPPPHPPLQPVQSRRRAGGRYEAVLPRHGASSSPLASLNMWAKEQQLALLDRSEAPRLALPKSKGSKSWAAPQGHSGGSGGSSPVIGAGVGRAAGFAAEQEGPFSIGTRVHREELEPVELV